eukprot:TRINITY_DN54984_c0_g1_i1.p1 TRINITY_DN54984_c0_g1~~TRINITY_DN54984_c0_g1_i1.p1  ORF type:complete len:312 (+),score=45.67 TRINITY_DN54984_c0_g1_i1:89-1024(+)
MRCGGGDFRRGVRRARLCWDLLLLLLLQLDFSRAARPEANHQKEKEKELFEAAAEQRSVQHVQRDKIGTKLNDRQRGNLKYLLGAQIEALKRWGGTWWLDRGTLMGTARNGRMIDFDYDGDIALLYSDFDSLVKSLKEQTLPETVRYQVLKSEPPMLRFTHLGAVSDIAPMLLWNGSVVDPYVKYHNTWRGAVRRKALHVRSDTVIPVVPCSLEGMDCFCPRGIDKYLSSQYKEPWWKPLPEAGATFGDMHKYLGQILSEPSPFLSEERISWLRRRKKILSKLDPDVAFRTWDDLDSWQRFEFPAIYGPRG